MVKYLPQFIVACRWIFFFKHVRRWKLVKVGGAVRVEHIGLSETFWLKRINYWFRQVVGLSFFLGHLSLEDSRSNLYVSGVPSACDTIAMGNPPLLLSL